MAAQSALPSGRSVRSVRSKISAIPRTKRFEYRRNRNRRASVDDRDRLCCGHARADRLDSHDDPQERQGQVTSLERVREELKEYEHPFFSFEAREKGEDVEMVILSKVPDVLSPQYRITLNERDV